MTANACGRHHGLSVLLIFRLHACQAAQEKTYQERQDAASAAGSSCDAARAAAAGGMVRPIFSSVAADPPLRPAFLTYPPLSCSVEIIKSSWDEFSAEAPAVLCLGLGSPSSSPVARIQLAFLAETCQRLNVVGRPSSPRARTVCTADVISHRRPTGSPSATPYSPQRTPRSSPR